MSLINKKSNDFGDYVETLKDLVINYVKFE